jgi:hypothetical protein
VLLLKTIIFSSSTEVFRIRGALAFLTNKNRVQPVDILGYPFNEDFCKYLSAFLQENKAYRKLFFESPNETVSMNRFNPDDLNYFSIINSILEFMVLMKLDLHLNEYFAENEIDQERITTISREGLAPAVLRNRVLEEITKDMKEREAFMQEDTDLEEGIIFCSSGKRGAIYERLDIELPPKSTINRNSDGFLVISNRMFDITILPQFEGYATVVPYELMPAAPKPEHFAPLLATIKIQIRLKAFAFVTSESMEMYEWLDSFVSDLEEYVSTDQLEKRLKPDLIRILKS